MLWFLVLVWFVMVLVWSFVLVCFFFSNYKLVRFQQYTEEEKLKLTSEVYRTLNSRDAKFANFLEVAFFFFSLCLHSYTLF